MVLTSGTAWPRRLLIAVLLAAILLVGIPTLLGDNASVPQTLPVAAAEPSVADNAKECVKNPIALATSFLGCTLAKSAVGAIKDGAGDGFKAIAKSMAQGWVRMIQLTLAWFIKIPTPEYAKDSVITDVQQATVQLQIYGLALSILIGSYKLVRARRQAVMNEAEESFTSLAKTVFGAWMFGGVLTVCTAASDSLADWMLDQGVENNEQLIANLGAANLVPGLGAGLVFVVAICGILGGLLQAVLLIGRQAMLAVVVAVIPLVGSFGGTSVGKDAFSKLIKWTVALLLWKPVAAIVYWVAFRLAGHDVKSLKDAQMALMGLILFGLSALVLPILMRLVSGGAAMSGGSGLQAGMMTAGVVAAAGTMVATGGASAAAGGASTAATAGASTGAAAGPSAGGGLSGGTGGGGPSPGGGGGGGGTGGGGSSPGRGGAGGGGTSSGSGGGSTAMAASGGGQNSPDQFSGGGSGSGSGTGGTSVGDVASASNAVASASQMLFDDSYESSVSAEEGSYR
ncbi:hypothetical protein HW572_04500 [Gordonia amicalis]|nr:hypothetical protein [Gordonia amicalis]